MGKYGVLLLALLCLPLVIPTDPASAQCREECVTLIPKDSVLPIADEGVACCIEPWNLFLGDCHPDWVGAVVCDRAQIRYDDAIGCLLTGGHTDIGWKCESHTARTSRRTIVDCGAAMECLYSEWEEFDDVVGEKCAVCIEE